MEYSKIIAVTGLPGLQELISSKTDGAIVRSLEDNVTKFVSSRIHNFSHLESIEVYTVRDNVNLADIFQSMEKSNVNLPDEKDAKAVKTYFEKVCPEIDFERVYNSDMKKMIKWFSELKSKNIEIKLSEIPEEEEEIVEVPFKKEVVAEKPKKETKEKPAKPEEELKKAAPAKKKIVQEKEEAPKKKTVAAPKKEKKEKETPTKKSTPKKK